MNLNSHFKQALIQSILNDLPDPGYKAKALELAKKYHESMIPDHIKKIAKSSESSRLYEAFFKYRSTDWSSSISLCVLGASNKDELTINERKEIQDLLELDSKRFNELRELTSKLQVAFNPIRTLAAMKKAFPEFEKYYPTEFEATKNALVDTTVVTSLIQAGWPKKPEKEVKPIKQKKSA